MFCGRRPRGGLQNIAVGLVNEAIRRTYFAGFFNTGANLDVPLAFGKEMKIADCVTFFVAMGVIFLDKTGEKGLELGGLGGDNNNDFFLHD
jgi:hypothetical protein